MSQTTTTTGVVVLDGELDIARIPDIAAQLNISIETFDGDVRFDSSAVTFIDAGALGALVAAANRLAQRNRALWMINTAPCVRRILELTHLDTVLPTTPA